MKSYTPIELIDEFRLLNGFFPTIQALTEKIRDLSTKHKCTFISYSVGQSRFTTKSETVLCIFDKCIKNFRNKYKQKHKKN